MKCLVEEWISLCDPNHANYDESKAKPWPDYPDPLTMKIGQKVTTAEMWWKQRRPEILADFDSEVYRTLAGQDIGGSGHWRVRRDIGGSDGHWRVRRYCPKADARI